MDDGMALHRGQSTFHRDRWDLSNMTKDLFGISFDGLFSKFSKSWWIQLLSYVLGGTIVPIGSAGSALVYNNEQGECV